MGPDCTSRQLYCCGMCKILKQSENRQFFLHPSLNSEWKYICRMGRENEDPDNTSTRPQRREIWLYFLAKMLYARSSSINVTYLYIYVLYDLKKLSN